MFLGQRPVFAQVVTTQTDSKSASLKRTHDCITKAIDGYVHFSTEATAQEAARVFDAMTVGKNIIRVERSGDELRECDTVPVLATQSSTSSPARPLKKRAVASCKYRLCFHKQLCRFELLSGAYPYFPCIPQSRHSFRRSCNVDTLHENLANIISQQAIRTIRIPRGTRLLSRTVVMRMLGLTAATTSRRQTAQHALHPKTRSRIRLLVIT